MAFQVAVCGPRFCTPQDRADAERVGELLADAGAVVICGGGDGVMAGVAAGVRRRSGLVVGIRPNDSREGASPDLSVILVTNMGEARNAIIVWSADVVLAIGGSWGTLSEIALAKRRGGIPVVVLNGWKVTTEDGDVLPGIEYAGSADDAVSRVLAYQKSRC